MSIKGQVNVLKCVLINIFMKSLIVNKSYLTQNEYYCKLEKFTNCKLCTCTALKNKRFQKHLTIFEVIIEL